MARTPHVRNYARNALSLGGGRMRRWRHSCCADRLARDEAAATLPALRNGGLLAHSYRHVTSDIGRERPVAWGKTDMVWPTHCPLPNLRRHH